MWTFKCIGLVCLWIFQNLYHFEQCFNVCFVLLTHFAPTVHFFPLAGDSISHGKKLSVWSIEQRRWQYCQQNTIFWVRISEYFRGLLSGIISMEWENCPSFCRIKIDGIFVSNIRLTSFFFFDEEWPKCFI